MVAVLDTPELKPLNDLFVVKGWRTPVFAPATFEQLPPDIAIYFQASGSMTKHLESVFGGPIHIELVAMDHTEQYYRRLVLLKNSKSRKPLLFASIEAYLDRFEKRVRSEIQKARKPFGRILEENGTDHGYQSQAFFQFGPGTEVEHLLQSKPGLDLFGRTKVVLDSDKRLLATVTEIPPRFRTPHANQA
ncbi:MAG: hypothetical protein K1Y02_22735 [Candidatus Hydrogenedentes bacterium]|nr:hypothetical protein [Candidatus Hydrogenedentota bacterium]